ncbi:MAG: hypothetical protein RLZZ574_2533 [Cyanobacteriota bacterium]
MIVAVADTHTIIWYLFNDERLSNIVSVISRDRKIKLSDIQTIW